MNTTVVLLVSLLLILYIGLAILIFGCTRDKRNTYRSPHHQKRQ